MVKKTYLNIDPIKTTLTCIADCPPQLKAIVRPKTKLKNKYLLLVYNIQILSPLLLLDFMF